jgi:hypothetical protein
MPVRALQHLPRHGDGEHVPAGKKVLGAVQLEESTPALQVHVVVQHAPGPHGFGLHEPPQMKVLGAAQVPTFVPLVHAPCVLQQTPMHGAGEQVAVGKKILGDVHVAAVSPVVQAHVAVQQAPAHGLGVHAVLQRKVKPEARQLRMVTFAAHTPVALVQQAPVQVVVVQVTPGWKVLGGAQLAPVVLVQAHELLQHAPVQGLGLQEVPPQMKVLGEVQDPAVEFSWHAPAAVQQMPGQGLGEQELPGPM